MLMTTQSNLEKFCGNEKLATKFEDILSVKTMLKKLVDKLDNGTNLTQATINEDEEFTDLSSQFNSKKMSGTETSNSKDRLDNSNSLSFSKADIKNLIQFSSKNERKNSGAKDLIIGNSNFSPKHPFEKYYNDNTILEAYKRGSVKGIIEKTCNSPKKQNVEGKINNGYLLSERFGLGKGKNSFLSSAIHSNSSLMSMIQNPMIRYQVPGKEKGSDGSMTKSFAYSSNLIESRSMNKDVTKKK